MLRHLGLIGVCACIVASVGCDGGKLTPPASNTGGTVEFGGRVVNADTGGPVGNVRVSVSSVSDSGGGSFPKPATSGAEGTFTLPVNLAGSWAWVSLLLTGPAGYDDAFWRFEPKTAGTRPDIRKYPTLVIRPGESIEVRVDRDVVLCAFGGVIPCRRVVVAASPGDPVELEIVPHDTSKPMGLGEDAWVESPVRRLMVAPGGVPYVMGAGTATLTARR